MRSLLRVLSMAVIAVVFVACGEPNDNPPTPVPPTPIPPQSEIRSYTIMTYGCGGGELDEFYEETIKNVTLLDVPPHINIVGQMKWSNGYKSEWSTGDGSVTRFQYNHAAKGFDNEPYGDNSFRIDDSANLAEFITWAREEAPADEYVIIFMGHGNAYHPNLEGSVTRAIMRDDEEPVYLGLSGIAEAFRSVDAHFSLSFMMCCLMNSIEYITELEPYTDYYLASSHVTSISSGEIYLILESLIGMEEYDDMSLVEAVTQYIDQDYDMWWSQNLLAIDHTLTKCSNVAALNDAIREFTDVVVALYDEEMTIGADAMLARYGFTAADLDEALSGAYYPVNATFSESDIKALEWYRMDYAFDIVDIATKVAAATQHSDVIRTAENIKSAAAAAITYQRDANLLAVERVCYTALLVNQSQWASLGLESAGYENTAFDIATGWSRLLKRNNAKFSHAR
ncbi:MAG: hypothetical protein IKU96_04350 [Alistipes sp.]|nr:hypothetical protein [Alistipes sp.]